jgi:hypothetical protein
MVRVAVSTAPLAQGKHLNVTSERDCVSTSPLARGKQLNVTRGLEKTSSKIVADCKSRLAGANYYQCESVESISENQWILSENQWILL